MAGIYFSKGIILKAFDISFWKLYFASALMGSSCMLAISFIINLPLKNVLIFCMGIFSGLAYHIPIMQCQMHLPDRANILTMLASTTQMVGLITYSVFITS